MPILINHQRSGTHYIQDLFKQRTGYFIRSSHDPEFEGDKVITIVRDPYDALHSEAVQLSHYGMFEKSHFNVSKYTEFYNALEPRIDVIIDYDTLINNPNLVVETIADMFDFKLNDLKYNSTLVDEVSDNHIITSKSSNLYNKTFFQRSDLDDAYKVYYSLLSRKTI